MSQIEYNSRSSLLSYLCELGGSDDGGLGVLGVQVRSEDAVFNGLQPSVVNARSNLLWNSERVNMTGTPAAVTSIHNKAKQTKQKGDRNAPRVV